MLLINVALSADTPLFRIDTVAFSETAIQALQVFFLTEILSLAKSAIAPGCYQLTKESIARTFRANTVELIFSQHGYFSHDRLLPGEEIKEVLNLFPFRMR
jgi:hypothetical protein